MPLSHVCVWDADIGYKRISLESACKMYPNGASAKSGYFVCELCAQNVLLTAPGVNVRHFRHDPSSPNKECDERQAHFDPLYGRRLRNLNSHLMPLRITVAKESFALQMGFFCPPDSGARCDKIRITTNSGKAYEYSFERIERGGTTYLNIGETPSREYNLEYINAAADLVKFWPSKVPGISSSGSFFDERTGQILPSGAKAYFGDSYYLLQSKPLGDLDLSDLHPFKDHPFGVRDDAEMKSLVESVRNSGVNQPALVRPREGGGYEIIAGHRRQMASQLAGYRNMPCIVRNMTDDEAILAMTDDNLRQRETILPSEKAMSLKMQYEAIKHQGARGDSAEAGKLSLESVGQRNGMSVKTVQRYIWLNDLVPELKQTMDDGKLSFTPAVEISRVRPKHQKYIAVSIEGQQASPSKGQAKRLRELDKENKLSPDVIDGILCEEKKKEDRDVIITGAELEKFFGKEATPRQMKDQIMTLLEDWKERQPPELAKPDKKMDMEK